MKWRNPLTVYREHIGITRNNYPAKKEIYCVIEVIEVAKAYLAYLSSLQDWHQNRQDSIEAKNSQIIGQASVVISIVALFIPLIVSNLSHLSLEVVICIVALFVLLLYHFAFAIIHATKTLEADRNRYMTGATSSVTKPNRHESELGFINEQISDLVQIINRNSSVTNRLAANLVYASRCFKIGIIGFGIYSCLLLFVFTKNYQKESHEGHQYSTCRNAPPTRRFVNRRR